MDRESLLLTNAVFVVGYAVAGHLLLNLTGRRSWLHLFQYVAPAVVVAFMLVVFVLMHGVTTVQFAAGDDGAMALWELWGLLWAPILLLLIGVGVCQLAWCLGALLHEGRALLAPLAFVGLGLVCQTFYTVAMYFPSV